MNDQEFHQSSDATWQEMVVELIKVGSALSAEQDHRKILEMIVALAQRVTNADGCTLYVKDEKEAFLRFALVRNKSLNVCAGGNAQAEIWQPVALVDDAGQENHRNVSAHCALTGKVVAISDVYQTDFDFQGTKDFDLLTGYRSKSMLVVPLKNHENAIIGVVQLLNAQDRKTGQVTDFCSMDSAIVASLASQAAIALTKRQLIDNLEKLLAAIVKMVGQAIDEKSPYTAGHIQRVAELTELFIDKINGQEGGPFGQKCFSEDEKSELLLAAWLHDVGKIVTPEHIIDKSTKLETIVDRIEIIRYRLELLKKDAALKQLKAEKGHAVSPLAGFGTLEEYCSYLDEIQAYLEQVNLGGEFLTDVQVDKITEIAAMTFEMNGQPTALLSEEEVANLLVRRGTLNHKEREIINNHVVVTRKMLDSLPFPKKHANVPAFAGMHHERLAGNGYPLGLVKEEIPWPAKALAVFDVFEALTAADRPYKLGKRLSESMKIIEQMAAAGELDEEICYFLVNSGLAAEYAKRHLAERQLDDFCWQGQIYSL
jgi:HD-GYP domain-containing protein (c-di-GMP phosphodiesterase class II)